MQENLNEIYSFLKENNALSLVLYKILGKGSMRRAHAWYDGNIVRYLAPSDMRSQRISDFLKGFGDESLIRSFYAKYLKPPESGISIDTTALPNQADLDITHCGHSSETMEEEIKLLLVMDRERNRPLYFRYLPGSILDVSVLETTRSEMENLGIRSSLTIMDAGFFSENNIGSMCDRKHDFLIRVPANRSIYRDAIERSSYIEDPDKAVIYGNRILFIQSTMEKFSGHSVHVHTILDPERRGRELRRYLLKYPKDYDAFTVKRKGFMVLMSSSHIEREKLIPLYYSRQYVEKAFSYSKDDLSLLPLRVHREESLRGYLFITFLSLIVYMEIQKRLESVELSMDILRNIKCKVYDREIVLQELTKDQKKLFEKINVIVPNVMGI
jgi:transposase